MAFRELISNTQPTLFQADDDIYDYGVAIEGLAAPFHINNDVCNYGVVIEGIILTIPCILCSEQGVIEYFDTIDLLFSDEANEEATLTISENASAELLRGLNINCEVILHMSLFSELQCRKLIIEPVHIMFGYEFINTYELEITHGHLHRIITNSNIVAGCKVVTINGAGQYANNKTALAFRRVFPNAVIIYFKSCLKLNRVTINKINSLINLGFIVAYDRYNYTTENIAFIPLSYSMKANFIHERSEKYYVSYGSVQDIINTSVAINYRYDTALIKNANK